MDEHQCDVSVVIPAHRAEGTIARTVESVLAQPGVRTEVIVVLDGCADDTSAEMECLSKVRLLTSDGHVGAPVSRNRGLTVAQAPFVMFLDADDYIEGPLLSSLSKALTTTGADVAFGHSSLEWPDGSRLENTLPRRQDATALITDWLDGNFVPPCAVLWRRSFLHGIGGWDPGLAKNQDGDLVFRAVLAGAAVTVGTSGRGIYYQGATGLRISTRRDRRSIESRGAVLERVLEGCGRRMAGDPAAAGGDLPALHHAVGKQFYACAVDAFDGDLDSMGELYLSRARSLGFEGHLGSPAAAALARIFGIRRLRSLKKMRPGAGRPAVRLDNRPSGER